MASHPRLFRSFPVALIVAVSAGVAGCSANGAAALTTTAIVRLPTGFHAARPTDNVTPTRAAARTRPAPSELATFRLEGAHRRAAAAVAVESPSATAGFVCQIDMGTAPLD